MATIPGNEALPVPEAAEGAKVPIAPDVDGSPVAAITPIRPTVRDKLLSSSTDGTVPPTATRYCYLYLI